MQPYHSAGSPPNPARPFLARVVVPTLPSSGPAPVPPTPPPPVPPPPAPVPTPSPPPHRPSHARRPVPNLNAAAAQVLKLSFHENAALRAELQSMKAAMRSVQAQLNSVQRTQGAHGSAQTVIEGRIEWFHQKLAEIPGRFGRLENSASAQHDEWVEIASRLERLEQAVAELPAVGGQKRERPAARAAAAAAPAGGAGSSAGRGEEGGPAKLATRSAKRRRQSGWLDRYGGAQVFGLDTSGASVASQALPGAKVVLESRPDEVCVVRHLRLGRPARVGRPDGSRDRGVTIMLDGFKRPIPVSRVREVVGVSDHRGSVPSPRFELGSCVRHEDGMFRDGVVVAHTLSSSSDAGEGVQVRYVVCHRSTHQPYGSAALGFYDEELRAVDDEEDEEDDV